MTIPAQYILNLSASNGTSNLTYLLNHEAQQDLLSMRPDQLVSVFGPGDESCNETAKGYTDPEWYWQSSDGCVWGIGWRWGQPRLRGRGHAHRGNDFFFKHPDPDTAAEFFQFLKRCVMQNA